MKFIALHGLTTGARVCESVANIVSFRANADNTVGGTMVILRDIEAGSMYNNYIVRETMPEIEILLKMSGCDLVEATDIQESSHAT